MHSLASRLLTLLPLLALGCARAPEPTRELEADRGANKPVIPASEPSKLANEVVIRVNATYPGANAQVVRDTVAAPIEHMVDGVEGMRVMESEARNDGSYTLTIRFTTMTDMANALVLVQNRVSLAEPALPEEVRRQGVTVRKEQLDRFPPLWIAIVSPKGQHDLAFAQNLADLKLRERLLGVAGIADERSVSRQESVLRVHLDPDSLAARELTVTDVREAIVKHNITVAVGDALRLQAEKGFQFTIEASDRVIAPDEVERIIVKSFGEGRNVYLRDVGKIEFATKTDGFARLDGKPTALLALSVFGDKPPTDAVRKALPAAETLPAGMSCSIAADLSADRSVIVELRLPEGTPHANTLETTASAEKALLALPGVAHCLAFGEREANVATLLVTLAEKNPAKPADIREALAKQIRYVKIRVSDLAGGVPFPVRIALCDTDDPDTKTLREWADKVAKRLVDEGIAIDPDSFPGPPTPHLYLEIDRVKLEKLGVSLADVTDALKTFAGQEPVVNDFNKFGRTWFVNLRTDPTRATADALKKLEVKTNDGQRVALGTFTAAHEMELSPLMRVDLYPAIKISAAVPPGKALADVAAKCEAIAEAEKPGKRHRVVDLTVKPR